MGGQRTAGLILANRTRWLGHGLAVIGVVALVGLNLIAPSAFVAEENIARVLDPSLVPPDGQADLDRGYLSVLPDDAIPVVVAALPRLPAADREAITGFLGQRAEELATDPAYAGWASWNLGRERAREALETLR